MQQQLHKGYQCSASPGCVATHDSKLDKVCSKHSICVQHGEPVVYKTQQHGLLLEGEVHISPGSDANTGILCKCCNTVVSCSKFEAHAGQGSRRCTCHVTCRGMHGLRSWACVKSHLPVLWPDLLCMPQCIVCCLWGSAVGWEDTPCEGSSLCHNQCLSALP